MIKVDAVPLSGTGRINRLTAPLSGLAVQDFPEIRETIRKYSLIVLACQMIIDERDKILGVVRKVTVMAVRDTVELQTDGRATLDVVISVRLGARDVGEFTERTTVPLDAVNALLEKMQYGDAGEQSGPLDKLKEVQPDDAKWRCRRTIRNARQVE